MDNINKPQVFKIKANSDDEKSTFVYLFESTLPDDEAEEQLKASGYEVLDVSDLKEKGILK